MTLPRFLNDAGSAPADVAVVDVTAPCHVLVPRQGQRAERGEARAA